MGGTIAYYMDFARRLSVEDRVQFVGELSHPALAELYVASDVVLLPSRRDTFGKVLAEGALANRPLVTTTACGAANSLVRDGDNGFIVPPGEPDQLMQAMTRLLDSQLRAVMGRRSRELVDECCDAGVETRAYVTHLTQFLSSGPKSS